MNNRIKIMMPDNDNWTWYNSQNRQYSTCELHEINLKSAGSVIIPVYNKILE